MMVCKILLTINVSKILIVSVLLKNVMSLAQKMKFFIKNVFSKCDQIHSFLFLCSAVK